MGEYLIHYGIKGQKWGIRRWQNEDGSLTSDGKKRYIKEYKEDNKKAFEYGKDASIKGQAAAAAIKRESYRQKRYLKKPTEKNLAKLKAAKETTNKLNDESNAAQRKAEAHFKELISKYGDQAVSKIKYDKHGVMNERVETGRQRALNVAVTLGTAVTAATVSRALGLKFIYFPYVAMTSTAKSEGRDTAAVEYWSQYNKYKPKKTKKK